MNRIQVSVLLPFYNPGDHFSIAVESVLNQQGINFELVLVNNNSDESSVRLATHYSQKFRNVLMIHERRQGIAHALNKGIENCQGEFIARMDADDVCLPGRLQHQLNFLMQHPSTGLIGGLVKTEAATTGMVNYINQINQLITDSDIYHHRFVESPFAHPSVMFRKSLIQQYGNYSTNGVPEDYELWLRWFSQGVAMSKLPVEVINWIDRPGRLTRQHPDYSQEAFRKIRNHYLHLWLKQHLLYKRPLWIWGGGKFSRRSVRFLVNNGVPVAGFFDVHSNRTISGYEVRHYSEIPPAGEVFIISMISNRGKFKEVREFLLQKGYLPERDFLLSA